MADIIPQEKSRRIEEIALLSDDNDAVLIAEQIMMDPLVRIHGPEHHFISAAAVIAAYCNKYHPDDKYKMLQMAKSRTLRIPVGMCALYGTCGAMMGAGAAASIILTAHPFDKDSLKTVNTVTAEIQKEISGYDGIRCCKRVTWASVNACIDVLNSVDNIDLPKSVIACSFSRMNSDCIYEMCPYSGSI